MSCLEGENCIPSYSLRHIAENYWQQEYVAVGIRLPAHGTVPGVLTDIEWRDWPAVTRLAVREARSKAGGDKPLGMIYPADIYSLSHVALPFPVSDSLYGRFPAQRGEFGISLGTLAARGERSVLVVDLDSLMRIASNPFFPYLLQRIDNKL